MGGSSNKKKPQRTGSKKESISKILKNSELNQKNLNGNSNQSNLAAIVKASSLKSLDGSSSSSLPGNASYGSSFGSSSNSGSGFGIKVTLLCLLYLARFGFVMLPQHGYIMPDEFFQSTEPIAGDTFDVVSLKTWEFNLDFPLRSIFFPQVLFGSVYYFIKSMSQTGNENLSRITAYALLVGPRLVVTLFSLLIDLSVLKICKILYSPGQNSGIFLTVKMLDILLIHASSYLAFTYYCHTFSNTVETVIFSMLLLWIIDSTTTTSKPRSCPNIRIGAALALGFFNRPTFALYAFVPTITWLAIYTSSSGSQRSKIIGKNCRPGLFISTVKNIFVNTCRLIGPFTVFTILMILADTWYYRGTERILELINIQGFEISEIFRKLNDVLILTPGNFMIYNLQSKNLSNHGLHPFYFHILVNFPLMFSLLGILWFYEASRKLYNGRFRLSSCGINILYGSILFVLLSFSFIPHQEPRFLMGLIVPLVCLLGHQIYGSTTLFTIWMLFNGALTVFYGHIHQAGVTASLFDIRNDIVRSYENQALALPQANIIFLRQYLPPRHLLAISKSIQNQVHIHDLSVTEYPNSFHELLIKLDSVKNSTDIFITGPGCLIVSFQSELKSMWSDASLNSIHEYFPHFTGEDFDKSAAILKDFYGNHNHDRNSLLTRVYKAFSFGIWKVEFKTHDNLKKESINSKKLNSDEKQTESNSEGEDMRSAVDTMTNHDEDILNQPQTIQQS